MGTTANVPSKIAKILREAADWVERQEFACWEDAFEALQDASLLHTAAEAAGLTREHCIVHRTSFPPGSNCQECTRLELTPDQALRLMRSVYPCWEPDRSCATESW